MARQKTFYWLIGAAVTILLTAAAFDILTRPASISGPMVQGAYVWQHRWKGGVITALQKSSRKFDTLYILAGETHTVSGQSSQVQIPDVDYKFLASLNQPVCLVIRVGCYSGPFSPESKMSRELLASVKKTLSKARSKGLQPCEIQIDFDCAESKLAGYKQWLKMISDEKLGVQLSFTALPSWLNSGKFKSLASQADKFVLQIHSFEPPKENRDYSILCSRDQAESWIWQAARMGRPFRVALPTYSYMVATNAKGKFIALAAEGLMPKLPKGATVKRADSPADELAELICKWQNCRPANMKGVIWFRLPIPDDRLNLSQAALDEIMQGRQPTAKLSIKFRPAEFTHPGEDCMTTYDIVLKNTGTLRCQLPPEVILSWSDGHCLAADGLNGYTLRGLTVGKWILCNNAHGKITQMPPAKEMIIGWLRLPKNTEIEYEFVGQNQK